MQTTVIKQYFVAAADPAHPEYVCTLKFKDKKKLNPDRCVKLLNKIHADFGSALGKIDFNHDKRHARFSVHSEPPLSYTKVAMPKKYQMDR